MNDARKVCAHGLVLPLDHACRTCGYNDSKYRLAKRPPQVVEVTTSNPEAVKRILEKIQAYGEPGHFFPIHGDNQYLLGYWDGDGSDRIHDIKVRKVAARYRQTLKR